MRLKFQLFVLFFLSLLLILTLNGCSKSSSVGGFTNPSTPVSTPILGKGSVTGHVVSMDGKPLVHTAVWAAEVACDHDPGDNSRCAFVLDLANSPGVYSDARGYFTIENIDPKKYVITVGDPQSSYYNIPNASGFPKVFDIPANKITDLGELKANLPLP
jgi:hypothetical protein